MQKLEDARNEQAFVEGRILALEQMLGTAVIIDSCNSSRETVGWDAQSQFPRVTSRLRPILSWDLPKADPASGHISNESPLGRALLGKKVGDIAAVHAPAGILAFKIIEIR